MMSMMSNAVRPPTRFISLHGHDSFSAYDGLGYPSDHIDFCLKNGLDGWSLTNHGNGNGLAHAHAHAKKIKSKGAKFRQLYGVEFYFVPDLADWKVRYDLSKQETSKDKGDDEEEAGLVVEDADETRSDTDRFVDVNKRYHLVVVAKNRIGLSNLFTLVKKSYVDGFYKFPRIDFKLLKEHGEGLVVSTACVGGYPSGIIYGEFAEKKFAELNPSLVDDDTLRSKIRTKLENVVDRFTDCVGRENFFLELQFNKLPAQDLTNRMMIETAKSTGCKLLSTADSHYPEPALWEAREIYRQLQPGRMKIGVEPKPLPKFEELKCELYPKNAQQMWDEYLSRREVYSWYEGTEDAVRTSMENGHDIAWNLCEEIWFDTSAKLPSFNTPEKSSFKQLVELVKEGLQSEGLDKKPEYVARAKMELDDIKYLKSEDYFMTLQKVFKVAENRTLPGSGRGSGAGSLVNYLLGITHVDPLKYDLLWERFMGRHRVGYPDIDTDVGDRDKLIEAAREIFGNDAVVPVSNFNTLKLKSLVKDVSKFYGVPFEEVNAMTGPLEREVENKSRDPNMEKSMFVLKHEDCMEHSENYRNFMEKYPQVEEKIRTLFMMNRSVGRHAGGVLICPDLEKHMPLITVRGELQTPWTEGVNIRNLEENGFLKFDFLGIKQMKMVEDCIARILTRELGREPRFEEIKKFYDDKLNCRYVEPNDDKVFEHVYRKNRWPGIFQFTSDGARRFCHEVQPNCIEDIGVVTAIYRPGPLKANVHKKYVEAKKDASKAKYDHPTIKDVLGTTYGFIAFQEQFMMLAQKLAGFTPGESDKMRKTLVKKDLTSLGKKSEEKEALEKKFIEGCVGVSGMDRDKAKELFDKIAFFSLYGFNKSHAIAYAIDSYYGAWLMTYYETDWLATCLQSENTNVESLAWMMSEIKQLGYKISQPDINYSSDQWMWSDQLQAFVPPLSSLKGVGDSAVVEIMTNRPYRSLEDLLFDEEGKWRHSKFNKKALSALISMEALSSLEEFGNGKIQNHKQLWSIIMDNFDTLKKGRYGTTSKKALKDGNLTPILDKLISEVEGMDDWDRYEKLAIQTETSGAAPFHLVFPPEILEKIKKHDIQPISEMSEGGKGITWFCVTSVEKKTTKNGKSFMRVKTLDTTLSTKNLRVWGEFDMDPYSIWMGIVSNDPNWGYSSNAGKLREIA